MDMNDILSSDSEFRYKLLDRLRSDCEYYLGYGNRHAKNLWAKSESDHISCMKALWESFGAGEKPEWLSMEKITEYETKMISAARDKAKVTMTDEVDFVAAEDAVYKLLEGAQIAKEYSNLNVNSSEYKRAMEQTEEFCQRAWPELYETVFGNCDKNFFFKDIPGYDFAMFYYNPDSNRGGQFVMCPFYVEQVAEMIGDDVYLDVLAENTQYVSDIDTYHFFDTLFELIEFKNDGKYLGNNVNEVCRDICLRDTTSKIMANIGLNNENALAGKLQDAHQRAGGDAGANQSKEQTPEIGL